MYKKMIIAGVLALGCSMLFSQDKSRGVSQPGKITIKQVEEKISVEIPEMEVEILFSEPSGDRVLSNGETATVEFIIKNKSRSKAIDPKLEIAMIQSWSPLRSIRDEKLSAVQPDGSGYFKATVPWEEKFESGNISIEAKVTDVNSGAVSKPVTIRFEVKAESYAMEKRLALIIGNSNYQNTGQLRNPVNDAGDLSEKLKTLGFDVDVRYDLTEDNLKRAIDAFGDKLSGYDCGLFYYAGHGAQAKGYNYLFPVDADPKTENDVEFECVRVDRILGKMEDAGNKFNILILDACRNNPFERSWTRDVRGRGLAVMATPSGSFVAFATSPGTTALDGFGRNGLYTSALLEHISAPNITIEELFKRVRATVSRDSNRKQVPWESTSLIDNFYFLRK